MIPGNRFSFFLAAFIITGCFFLALPEKGISGIIIPPVELGCCQFDGIIEGSANIEARNGFYECTDMLDVEGCAGKKGEFFVGAECNMQTGMCMGFQPVRNVPTLSEWGLIAMAGLLAIVGFMVMRRRKVTA